MLEFFDINNGNIFHIDSFDETIYNEAPYTFWFENGQSTNLNYILKVGFITDIPIAKIECDSEVFSLLKLDQNAISYIHDHQEEINAKQYIDLELLKTNSLTLNGFAYENYYIYMIYILARSEYEGEFRDDFYITINRERMRFEVGADFYNKNEILKSNLQNFESDLPESIQRAIYDIDVHEEANDNIVLNRKYKELLMKYWDIVANRGSYNSLLNSLAWFEWGDMTRIEEIWERHQMNFKDYIITELNRELDQETLTQLYNHAKTTYIGLYTALSKLIIEEDGTIMYQDEDKKQFMPEPMPLLRSLISKWSVEDLMLKMTLLGNFYKTYFMPIHLDLIHSTVENWVFTYAYKLLCVAGINRNDFRLMGDSFILTHADKVQICQWDGRTYTNTLFKQPTISIVQGAQGAQGIPTINPVFGFDTSIHEDPLMSYNTQGAQGLYFNPLQYFYGGSTGKVDFHATIYAEDIDDRIYYQRLTYCSSTDHYGEVIDNSIVNPVHSFIRDSISEVQPGKIICVNSEWIRLGLDHNTLLNIETVDGDIVIVSEEDIVDENYLSYGDVPTYEYHLMFDFDFTMGFRYAGNYILTFEFRTTSGNSFIKRTEVEVEDTARDHIELYFVQGKSEVDISDANWYRASQMMRRTDSIYREHSVLVSKYNMSGDQGRPGYNRTIIANYTNDLGELPETDFLWIDVPDSESHVGYNRIIGICKKFYGYDEDVVLDIPSDWEVLVDQYRFHPFMHDLVSFDSEEDIEGYRSKVLTGDELMYVVPQLDYSRKIDDCTWTFINESTGKSYKSYLVEYPNKNKVKGGMIGSFVDTYNESVLEPGYYTIILTYRKGGIEQQYLRRSAFLISK